MNGVAVAAITACGVAVILLFPLAITRKNPFWLIALIVMVGLMGAIRVAMTLKEGTP